MKIAADSDFVKNCIVTPISKEDRVFLEDEIREQRKQKELKRKLVSLLPDDLRSSILASGRSFVIEPKDVTSGIELESTIIHTTEVSANATYWHNGVVVEPGKYRLKASSDSRWTMNYSIPNSYCSYGTGATGFFNIARERCRLISAFPSNQFGSHISVGLVAVLVYQHQSDGTAIPNIGYIKEPFGQNLYFYLSDRYNNTEYIEIGNPGGSIHFLIADDSNGYNDNAGSCQVQLTKDF